MPVPPSPGNALPNNPVTGTDENNAGVTGESNTAPGVIGKSFGLIPPTPNAPGGTGHIPQNLPASDGVLGIGLNGIHGQTSDPAQYGGFGENLASAAKTGDVGAGVYGVSKIVHGVYGTSNGDGDSDPSKLSLFSGVYGLHTGKNGPGVFGCGTGGFGVLAVSYQNYGLFATGTKGAASFQGDVKVVGNVGITGNITSVETITVSGDVMLTGGMDCAEHFDSALGQKLEPGTVVVIDADGMVEECHTAYDKRVAGIVSGAGEYRPGLLLGNSKAEDAQALIALIGKVFCKVDAGFAPIEPGDILTSSPTPGHAMKASDAQRAFGAVLGKALRGQSSGRGLIPVLVTLQ